MENSAAFLRQEKRGVGRPPAPPSNIEVLPDGEVRVHLVNSDRFAIIDAIDIPAVSAFAWYPRCAFGIWYARLSGRFGGKKMHQLTMPAIGQIDHRDGDGLNNRRANLRPSTQRQNRFNAGKRAVASSSFKGVRFRANRFEASIACDGKRYPLGRFVSEEMAARAYDAAAINLHGEFARLNFPT